MRKTYSIAILAAMTATYLTAEPIESEPIKYGPIKYALTPPPELAPLIESEPIKLDLTPPKSEWVLRNERAKEMEAALKLKESRRLAAVVNRRRYLLNEAAHNIARAASIHGKPIRATIDFTTGDILVEIEGGEKILQRYDEKKVKAAKVIYRKANGKRPPKGHPLFRKKKGGENVR